MSLDELFEEFDPDHSGDMDRNELDIAMRRLGAKLSSEGVDAGYVVMALCSYGLT